MSPDFIDHSAYPDLDEFPSALETDLDKADYIHRVCKAWDYGVHPDLETFTLFAQWMDVFDRFPVPTSIGYHAFRAWFSWDPVLFPTTVSGPTLRYQILDRLEGRDEDPCEHMIKTVGCE